jgi:hemerythrin
VAAMIRAFVIVVADDRDFRNDSRRALVTMGCRVAAPTTREGAEYFLASVYPPHVVVVSAGERWQEILRDPIQRTVRRVAMAVVDRCRDERRGAGALVESVRAALEQLISEPMAWRDDLSFGVERIDAPHRAQVALLAALEGAVRAGRRQNTVDRLRELQAHTEAHFSGEESLLQLHGGHDLEEHAREHARMLDEIRELEARWAGDDLPAIAPVILSLRDSLEGHIRTLDRALAHRLAPQGAPSKERGVAASTDLARGPGSRNDR